MIVPAFLLALLTAPADSLAGFMGHGIAHDLAIWRARTIRDVRYELSLDLIARDSAMGRVIVRFQRTGEQDAILDYRGRRLLSVSVNGTPLAPTAPAFNGNHLRVPAALLQSDNAIELAFV